MGDTHWRSNLKAKDGSQTISGFNSITGGTITATTLTVNTSANIPSVTTNSVTATTVTIPAGQYMQLGDHQYIFFGDESADANIVAVATAVDASVKGSLYMSRDGSLWIFDADDSATQLSTV